MRIDDDCMSGRGVRDFEGARGEHFNLDYEGMMS